ncbi:MAG: GGDEF domain-containing phosphodiesterase [Treponema sp.]|nr:GGDEF domain-containing phosphodiesterase [Treponema sp.]
MNLFSKHKTRIKNHFPGLFYTPYVKDYLFMSNVRSSIYLSTVISILEIFMLIFVFSGNVTRDRKLSETWIINHIISYIILLVTSVSILIYSLLYIKGKIKNKIIGSGLRLFFSIVAIAFGLYISYNSYDKSGQVFAFLTMETLCLSLLVWHPINHFIFLTLSFAIYYHLQRRFGTISLSILINSATMWIALLMTGINIHHQRCIEATKNENLEKLTIYLRDKSLKDELTKLSNLDSFQRHAIKTISDESVDISTLRFVYTDIENFKNYNERHGFRAGNNFLRKVAKIMEEVFNDDLIARFSDDHFISLSKIDGLEAKINTFKERIQEEENGVSLGLKCGLYMPADRLIDPSVALDCARYACISIKKNYFQNIAEYNREMNREFKVKQYIINNIDNALKKGDIEVYYQPVIWAEDGKVCGAEALARWNDPIHGFLAPATFIPVLEEYHQIHKLDMYILETVCQDIEKSHKNNYPSFPISVNFSRLDFQLGNPVNEISDFIKKYNINKDDIHIEITESALTDEDSSLKESIEDFRAKGFSLWLDDFGSGYSGLNVLKDFSFDTMKIDMKFLSHFSDNQKTQPILTSIIELAKRIGMETLTEGVETQEAYDFLKKIGCQRLQGYLFGKPLQKEIFLQKLLSGEYQVHQA